MKVNQNHLGARKILVALIYYLTVILAALMLGLTQQIAGWVEQVVIALSLGRIIYVVAWCLAKNGWGWRV